MTATLINPNTAHKPAGLRARLQRKWCLRLTKTGRARIWAYLRLKVLWVRL